MYRVIPRVDSCVCIARCIDRRLGMPYGKLNNMGQSYRLFYYCLNKVMRIIKSFHNYVTHMRT